MALGDTVVPRCREGEPNGRILPLQGCGKGSQFREGRLKAGLKPSLEAISTMGTDHLLKLAAQALGTLDLGMAADPSKEQPFLWGQIVGGAQQRPDQLARRRE